MRKKFIYTLICVGIIGACQTTKPAKTTTNTSTPVTQEPVAATDSLESAEISETDSLPAWAASKGKYNPERTKLNDLLHTKLEVSFDWQKQYLNGIATLTFKPYFYPQNTLILDAKGFDIKGIKLIDEKTKKSSPLQHQYDGKHLTIQLDKTYTRAEQYMVEVVYTAKPNELPEGGSEAITSDKGLYFINADGSNPNKPRQIWTQGETEANSAWFPTIDSPNERTTQEMYITVDSNFVTLSNGALVYSRTNRDGSRTDYWKQDKSHAPYLFMMAIGEYAVVEDKWNNLPVNYYVEPAYAKYAKDIFGRTPEMLEFFSNKLNYKFPWDKYSQVIVRDFVSGAMENTSAVTFMEAVQVDNRSLLDEHWDNIIAHELFHHWFGDLVTTESWANLPLNESFANYSEYLWNEHKYGVDEADFHSQGEEDQYLAESEDKQEPLIRYNYLDKEDMFDSHSYAKGGRVLHMLRKYVGDDAFFEALNLYLKKNEFSDVEIHNLRLAFEEVTGEDLNWFFNQWFLSAGHPELEVSHQYTNGKVVLQVNQLQDSVYTPIYKLPLKVDVWVNGKKERHQVVVNQASQTIEIPAAAKPDLVLFDGETQLLGLVMHEKSPEEWAFQYANSDKYLARYEAIAELTHVDDPKDSTGIRPAMDSLGEKIAIRALDDKFWHLRQLAVQSFEKYNGSQAAAVEAKLRNLATSDPRSYVRAEAINVLSSWEGKDYAALYAQGLEDKSYAVAAASLFAYMQTGAPDLAEKVAKFKQYTDNNIIFTVAYYYTESGDPNAYDWFVERLRGGSTQMQQQFIQFFAAYLTKLPAEKKMEGIQVLEKVARQDPAYQVRLSAYQWLGLFEEMEEVKAIRKDIREKEKNEKLRNLYNMVP
jgi:aminopeptidase N